MKETLRNLMAICFAVILSSSVFATTPANEKDEKPPLTLSVLSANVSGLPAIFSKYDRDVQKSQKTLGEMLNESGHDIVCVQEDFQYHDTLDAQMTEYPYKTYTSGGVPIGDGVNIFSKYPIYNVERVTWKKYNGVFADGLDALTPKGFIKCTVDVDNVLIDLYNLHGDAYRTEGDQYAKKAQLLQLAEYIKEFSQERPIIITGDTNLTFHNDPLADMYQILIAENGFTDTWVELKNGGNYLQGENAQILIANWYEKFGGHDWGRWDSVERLLYKNGDGLQFKPTRFEYTIYTDDPAQIKALTDHRMMECTVKIDISNYERPANIALEEENPPSFFQNVFHVIGMSLRFVLVLLFGIFDLLIAFLTENIYIAVLLGFGIVSFISLRLIKLYKQKRR